MKRSILSALVVAAASTAVLAACASGTSSVPGKNLLDLINDKRVAHGCKEVSGNNQLRVAAERHAVDIRDHPAHFGPPGTNPPLADIHTGTDGSNVDRASPPRATIRSHARVTTIGLRPARQHRAGHDRLGGWAARAIASRSKTACSRRQVSACLSRWYRVDRGGEFRHH